MPTEQVQVNEAIWRRGDYVASYANRSLLPVEVMIFLRYRDALRGRVLEAGCGAGRVLGYLVALGGDVHGIDISPAMVEYCRRAYPEADVRVGDMSAIRESVGGQFDAILAVDNVIDVFDDAGRRRVLGELRELIAPDGLLIFSSHNLESVQGPAGAGATRLSLLPNLTSHSLRWIVKSALRLPRRVRNRRRLRPLERRAADHAILNDAAHDYALLHYYVRRDDQARQLDQLGYELIECLDAEGSPVAAGQSSSSPWLHYVARPRRQAETG